MNIQGCVPRFLKHHGSLILTILSGIGLVGTVILTAKVAPMAKEELEEEQRRRYESGMKMHPELVEESENGVKYEISISPSSKNLELTRMEQIKIAAPFYVPVILLGIATLSCMAGAHICSVRQQAAMVAAYELLEKSFGAYRQEIRDNYGAAADKQAYIASQKKIRSLEEEIRKLEQIKGVMPFTIATCPGLIFRTEMATIERAFLHFNRNLAIRGSNTLEELYSFLGIPANHPLISIPKAPDEDYGWNEYENEVNWGCSFLDFRLEKIEGKDGKSVYMIDFVIPPYRIDGMDYGNDDSDSFDEIYEGYRPEEARSQALNGATDAAMLIDPEHTVTFAMF